MRKLILLTFLVFFLPFVLGETDVFQQNTNVDLQQSCYFNGTYCTTSATCNISVFSPTAQVIVANDLMTNQFTYHNYTLNITQTDTIGQYEYRIVCEDQSNSNFGIFQFLITPSGTNPNTAQGQLYIALFLAGIIFFVISLWGTIRIKWGNTTMHDGTVVDINDMKYLKLLLAFMSYLFLIFISWTAWKIGDFFLWFDLGHGVFSVVFWILAAFLFPVLIITGLTFFMAIFKDRNLKKLLGRNLQPR